MNDYLEITYHFDTPPLADELLTVMQDIAEKHSENMGAARSDLMRDYNAFWMVVRAYYHLNRQISAGDLRIKTWQRGCKGIIVYRDFDLFMEDELVGEAVQAWLVADFDTKKMLRPEQFPSINRETLSPLAKDISLGKLRAPKGEFETHFYTITKDDIDVNGHMNNCRYAHIVTLALGTSDISDLQINYVAECFEGETLELHVISSGGKTFVHGQDTEGNARFEALLRCSQN